MPPHARTGSHGAKAKVGNSRHACNLRTYQMLLVIVAAATLGMIAIVNVVDSTIDSRIDSRMGQHQRSLKASTEDAVTPALVSTHAAEAHASSLALRFEDAKAALVAASEASDAIDEAAIWQTIDTYNCTMAYLDVGSNIGVQIRKLFEPHLYRMVKPNQREYVPIDGKSSFVGVPPVLSVFDEKFGSDKCRVCAFGFEPNPNHHSRLELLQSHLKSLGFGVHVFYAAAAELDGVVHFRFTNASAATIHAEDWGAKRVASAAEETEAREDNSAGLVGVKAIDLVRILDAVDAGLTRKAREVGLERHGPVVMKLDIEGSEFGVLPHAMLMGSFCRVVDLAFIEWHDRFFNANRKDASKGQLTLAVAHEMHKMLHAAISSNKCKTELSVLDDETFLHDGAPMISGTPLCARQ